MSVIQRECKIIKKSTSLSEFSYEELSKVGKYWAQNANDLFLRDGCMWLDGRLFVPLPKRSVGTKQLFKIGYLGTE